LRIWDGRIARRGYVGGSDGTRERHATRTRFLRRSKVVVVAIALATLALPAGMTAVSHLDLTGEQLAATVAFAVPAVFGDQ